MISQHNILVNMTDMIEFGAIVVDKYSLREKESFSTLIHSRRITKRYYPFY